jgi:predicted secreted protein
MGWVPGIVVYIIIWWVVIFAVLPFGVRPAEEGDVGHAAGAPGNPRLLRKAVVTTLISAALWLMVYWAITSSLFSFRENY